MKRTCKQCGAEFTLSEDEIAFYRGKNLHLPKRCEQCRRENRAKAGEKPAQQTVRLYREKKNSGIKWWAAVVTVCVLLVLAGGAFCVGGFFERTQHDAANEMSSEATESFSPAAGVETETPSETRPDISGEADDEPADTGQDMQADISGEMGSVPPDTVQDTQPEVSAESGDASSDTPQKTPEDTQSAKTASSGHTYSFRKAEYLQEHFEKHGDEFGYTSADEYLAGANRVVVAPGVLHKLEAEDGDDVYYLESSNEFVIVSTDGYIRTYFKPNDGKAYFDRQ